LNKPISTAIFGRGPWFPPRPCGIFRQASIGHASCSWENAAIADLLDKRLAFVTGKGGVGKTTVAYALGLAAAASGRSAIVCEIAAQERGSRMFGRSPVGFNEVEMSDGLWAISIDPDDAIREYLEVQLPVRAMGQLLHRSRLFSYLAAATPGLAEMVTVGKVWELALSNRKSPDAPRTYDLVIVDAPATGHGVGFLQTPGNFAELARVGPLANQAGRIEATLADREQTGVVIVTTPEEMAVNESVGLEAALTEAGDFAVDRIYANAVYPRRFDEGELANLKSLGAEADAAAAPAIAAAIAEMERALAQEEELERLRERTDAPVSELPFLFADQIGAAELARLAEAMG
jgi:anion-transporting  ArsA/GET3 family ATPase